MDEANDWSLNLERLPQLITDKIQAIVRVSPSYPTGKIFTEQELTQVGEIARTLDILLIIDDPYSDFCYENASKYFILASVERFRDPGAPGSQSKNSWYSAKHTCPPTTSAK